jgi:hypothetical protein
MCHGFYVLFLQVWSCWLRQRPEGAASTGGCALLMLVTVVAMTMLPMLGASIAILIFSLIRCAQFQNVLGCDEEEEEEEEHVD